MKLRIDQAALARGLVQTSRLVTAQNVMPILAGIQMTATATAVILESTDLFNTLTLTLPAEVEEPGRVLMPAAAVTELVTRIATPAIGIQTIERHVRLSYGRNHATVYALGDEPLPEFPVLDREAVMVAFTPDILSQLLAHTHFACARDEARPVLKGIRLEWQDDRLVAIATDGHRLSRVQMPMPDWTGEPLTVIMPVKALSEATRLGDKSEPITMICNGRLAEFRTEHAILKTRLLDGEYPDYQRVFPVDYPVQIDIPLAELRGAVERVQLIASQDANGMIQLAHSPGLLRISATASQVGRVEEKVECVSEGSDMTIPFSGAYVLDALKSLAGERVTMQWSGVQSAMRISNDADPTYEHLVLPLRMLS